MSRVYSPRSNGFAWTWFNPNGVHPVWPDKVDYYVYQLEKCPTTGTPHYQGYVHFKNAIVFSTIQKLLPHATINAALGTPQENLTYCTKKYTKDGFLTYLEGPWTKGNLPAPGTRNDLTRFKEDYKAGMGKRKLVDTHFETYAKYSNGLERAMKILKPCDVIIQSTDQFRWNPVIDWNYCHVVYGATGLGKTEWAISRFKNPLLVREINTLLEFDRTEHDGIVFDDMSFWHIPPTARIHLTDMTHTSAIKILYTTIDIPANTRKIFTFQHNTLFYGGKDLMLMSPQQEQAINRRVKFWEITESLYVSPRI